MGKLVDLDTVPHRRVRFKTSNDSSSMANELDVVFYEDLIQLPTVDAVPVVRCKDCIHCSKENCWTENGIVTLNSCWNDQGIFTYVLDNDYCSRGYRKEETK